MLTGHARVSKADGSQSPDLQRDTLIAAGVSEDRICSGVDLLTVDLRRLIPRQLANIVNLTCSSALT